MALRLHRGKKPGRGLLRCVRGQLEKAERALLETDPPPSKRVVHRTRRCLKKSRAALRLLRKSRADKTVARECNLLLRDAGRALSRTRDAHVALKTFKRLMVQKDLKPLKLVLARNAARHDKGEGDALERIRQAAAKLQNRQASDLGRYELTAGMTRLYKRARHQEGKWKRRHDSIRLHEWRKRLKDLLFTLKMARSRCGHACVRLVPRLKKLGKIMGRRIDLEVLARITAKHADGILDALLEIVGPERARLDRRVKKAARKLFDAKPRAFRKSIM